MGRLNIVRTMLRWVREVVEWMVEGAGDCGIDIGPSGRQVVARIGE